MSFADPRDIWPGYTTPDCWGRRDVFLPLPANWQSFTVVVAEAPDDAQPAPAEVAFADAVTALMRCRRESAQATVEALRRDGYAIVRVER